MIFLTDAAVEHTKEALAKRGKGLGIRVGVKTTGCSGFAYTLEFVDGPLPSNPPYDVFKTDDVSVFVAPKDLVYLNGLKMDYVKQGLNEGFEFSNPQEASRCGCGESFSV
jgi:iron-sulfur cluster assembly protein